MTTFLNGMAVLVVSDWSGAGTAMKVEGSTQRWEYKVDVDNVQYSAAAMGDFRTGSTTLVTFVTDVDGRASEPTWNLASTDPVYLVVGRSSATFGGMREGDLVLKGVFDGDLNLIGNPEASAGLQEFVASLDPEGAVYAPRASFLVDWVRSLNEQSDENGVHPVLERWLEYGSPPDEERNVTPAEADPEIAAKLVPARVVIDATELEIGAGVVALFSERGQLASIPGRSSRTDAVVWVLPGEQLEIRVLYDAGTSSESLIDFSEQLVEEQERSAEIVLTGDVSSPAIKVGPAGERETADTVTTVPR